MPTSRRFIRSVGLISALTLASRVLGLVREQVLGFYFATSQPLSAFRIAFMLPNLARRLFGEGALSAALIPVLTRSLRADGEVESRRFVGSLLVLLGIVLVGGVVGAELVILVWRQFSNDLALSLSAVLIPYMVLICLVAAIAAVLNVRGHFAVPAAAPSLLNLAVIGGVLFGARVMGLEGVKLLYAGCVGVLIGGLLQLTISVAALRWVSFVPILSAPSRSPRVRAVGALMAPMALGLSAVQLNTVADFLIAYFFVNVEGEQVGPAVLGFAQYLYQLPLGVFGIALSTAIFPLLSQRAEEEDQSGLASVFADGLRLSVFIALPASVGLMIVARPLVSALYERGAFGPEQTARVSGVLIYYAMGMVAYFAQHILVRTFYALHDSRTPARVALTLVGVNLVMNFSLVFVLEERGLALATAICAHLQMGALLVLLSRRLPQVDWRLIGSGVTRSAIATGIMGAVLLIVGQSGIMPAGAIGESAVVVLTGAITYGIAVWCLGSPEIKLLTRRT